MVVDHVSDWRRLGEAASSAAGKAGEQNVGDEQNIRKPDAEPDWQGSRRGEILTSDEYQIVRESDKQNCDYGPWACREAPAAERDQKCDIGQGQTGKWKGEPLMPFDAGLKSIFRRRAAPGHSVELRQCHFGNSAG